MRWSRGRAGIRRGRSRPAPTTAPTAGSVIASPHNSTEGQTPVHDQPVQTTEGQARYSASGPRCFRNRNRSAV